ncbi:hypothetical protein SV7mr_28970 [Stieleria bergensis]|uniref:Uncharacterized protein n=1 Tax=Stieleria bergensis TaxID=2528025 RepID=A0A517SW68_9BACT|nr:hypothetical protein SV7mr_28970 [Planctomycetes bacterium SV_7m_r]
MNDSDLKLIEDYLSGAISPENLEALNKLLETNEAARERYLELATMDEGLHDLAAAPSLVIDSAEFDHGPSPLRLSAGAGTDNHKHSMLSSPWISAAAGLLIGVVCTSAIWAATETGRQKLLTSFRDSFESGPVPQSVGGPVDLEAWGGDYVEIADCASVEPFDGKRALRFLRADYAGKENPVGYVADIYRVIDLRGNSSLLANGDALATVQAMFSSTSIGDPDRFIGNLSVNALAEVPASAEAWRTLIGTTRRMEEASLASARRREVLSPEAAWQQIDVEMRLPTKAQFLLIGLHVADHQAARSHGFAPPAVKFENQYVDDVRVTIGRVR